MPGFVLALMLLIFFPFSALGETISWDLSENIDTKILSQKVVNHIVLKEVQYTCGSYEGKAVNIFGFFAYPKAGQKLPAVILVHGGGGYARADSVLQWAGRGYAALAIDLPGKGPGRAVSRSSGPNMSVAKLLKTQPVPEANYLYHAVKAARGAITFMQQNPLANSSKIGMVGVSWGGVITLIINGLDDRLAAAVPIFGTGFLTEGSTWQRRFDQMMSPQEKDEFAKTFDPSNFLKTQHAPLLYITGTNDHCFYLPNFIRSYLMVPANIKMVILPNLKHHVTPEVLKEIFLFCEHRLKDKKGFPSLSLKPIEEDGTHIYLPIRSWGPDQIDKVIFFYTSPHILGWTKKKWREVQTYQSNNYYWAKISKVSITPEIIFYVSAQDIKGAQVSTPVYSIMHFKINNGEREVFVESLPIEKINYHYLSPDALGKIMLEKPDSMVEKIPLKFFWDIGGELYEGNSAFYLTLPK